MDNTEQQLPRVVYTPEKGLVHPWRFVLFLLRDIFSRDSRELARRMMIRNINAKYRQSLLGLAWIFLPALINALIWVFLNRTSALTVAETSVPYPVFAVSGTILWQIFSLSIVEPITAIKREKALLTKVNIPREALLMSGIGELIINSFVQFLILIPVFLWFHVSLSWCILLVPFAVVALIAAGFSIGLILTPIGVLYDDIGKAIPILTRFWFFLTPVVYPIPENTLAATIFRLNPATSLITTARELLTGQPITELAALFLVIGGMAGLSVVGLVFYRLTMPVIIERMSA